MLPYATEKPKNYPHPLQDNSATPRQLTLTGGCRYIQKCNNPLKLAI